MEDRMKADSLNNYKRNKFCLETKTQCCIYTVRNSHLIQAKTCSNQAIIQTKKATLRQLFLLKYFEGIT